MENKPVVGDTVKLYGIVGQYNGKPQMKNAWIVAINPSDEPVDPEEPSEPDAPVTPDEPGTDSPVTGDNSTVYVTLAVVLMALAAAAAFITSKKRA
jgi:LPXTG-motif cell wall-anchored protein